MVPLFSSRFIFLGLGLVLLTLSATFKSNFSAGKEYKNWMAMFLLFIFVSILWSIRPLLTVYTLVINVFPIFCLTYSLSRYINSYDRLIDIFKLIYVGGVISLIYLFLFVDMTQLAGNRISAAMTDDGLAETWNINSIGMNLALSILIGYVIVKHSHSHKSIFWFIWLIVSLAMLFTIMLTGSRKALLILILPFLIFAFYNYKKHLFKAIIMILVAVIIIWIALKIPFFYDIIGRRIEELINIVTGNTTGHEDNSRKILIELGWNWFCESPICGYGMNCFRVLSDSVARFAGKNFYAHNNYIEILVGGGIIGFCIYYSYILLLLRRLRHHRGVLSRYAAIILSILLIMDFANVSYYDVIMQMLIVFAFILVRLKQVRLKQPQKLVATKNIL